jgi:hypothetical protein
MDMASVTSATNEFLNHHGTVEMGTEGFMVVWTLPVCYIYEDLYCQKAEVKTERMKVRPLTVLVA